MHFTFTFTLENIGYSPAMRVFPHAKIYPTVKFMDNEAKVLKAYLASVGDLASDTIGNTIPPKGKVTRNFGYSFSNQEYEHAKQSYTIDGQYNGMIPIKLVGVLAYRSAVSSTIHHTSFYYDVGKYNGYGQAICLLSNDLDNSGQSLSLSQSMIFSPYMT